MNPLLMMMMGGGGGDISAGGGLLSGAMPSGSAFGLAGLSGLSSAASTLASIGQIRRNGANQQTSYYQQAMDEYLNSNQSYVSGVGQVAGLRQKLSTAIGQRAAVAGASGVDGGQGIVQDNAAKMENAAVDAGQVDTLNADIESRRHIINALAAIRAGNQAGQNASDAASASALSGGIGGALSIAKLLL